MTDNHKVNKKTRRKKKYNKFKTTFREKRTLELIELLGDQCALCKKTYPPCAYDFHHKDPSTKRFNISQGLEKNYEVLVKEAKKCILLCANCHRIAHVVQDKLFKKEGD